MNNKIHKQGKFVNNSCCLCGICGTNLEARKVVKNPGHLYNVGTLFTCRCGQSQIWTNSIRNYKALVEHLNSDEDYYQGFCNDKLCGLCFAPIVPKENGVLVVGHENRFDRLGCQRENHNQQIMADGYAEDPEGNVSNIIEWYRQNL